jgi:hypothetical protein
MVVLFYDKRENRASLSYKLVGSGKKPGNYRSSVSTKLLIKTKIKLYVYEISKLHIPELA